MNHTQQPNLNQVENHTAMGIVNEAINHKIYKAMNMQLYWIYCRIMQDQFIVYWKPGKKIG